MNCEEARFKINALIDNELSREDALPLFQHLSTCESCRNEYLEQIELHRSLKAIKIPEPTDEWYENFPKRLFRKISGIGGRIFFIGSYILLLAYALYQLFVSPETEIILKIIIGGLALGFIILLSVSITDRIKESKNDNYKGVIR